MELYDDYTPKIRECDAQIERRFLGMKPRFESDARPPTLPPVKPASKSTIQPAYNVRAHLMRLTGVDLVALTRISASIAQTILSEVGTDMSRFSTVKHFCSWLGLAPHNDISGGRVLRSRTLKVVNRATQAFRQAAQSVARSHSAFGAYFRSMRARLGPEQATVATAHKIARVVYHPAEVSHRVRVGAARAGAEAPQPPSEYTGLHADPKGRLSTSTSSMIPQSVAGFSGSLA